MQALISACESAGVRKLIAVIGDSGTVGPFSDAFKRHAYNQVIRLNNPSGRREVP